MNPEKLFTIREAAQYLGMSEKEIIELAETGKIPAYKIAGVYLRFKKEQLDKTAYRHATLLRRRESGRYNIFERLSDFFYYHDFYVLSALLIVIMLYVIFRT